MPGRTDALDGDPVVRAGRLRRAGPALLAACLLLGTAVRVGWLLLCVAGIVLALRAGARPPRDRGAPAGHDGSGRAGA